MEDHKGYLTIKPAYCYHDDIEILGDRAALMALSRTIQKVLYSPKDSKEFNTFNSDGEGYALKVNLLSGEEIKKIKPIYINFIDDLF